MSLLVFAACFMSTGSKLKTITLIFMNYFYELKNKHLKIPYASNT